MTGWLVLAAYVGGFLFTYRRAYPALIASHESHAERMGRRVDGEEKAMAATMSMLASFMWPVVLVGYAVWRFATPTTPGEKKAELDAREREIERLERELGIPRSRRN